MMQKITFIGSGAWASGLATVLSKNNKKVTLWGIDQQEISDINNGMNTRYFGETKFNNPQNVRATADLVEALEDFDLLVLAVPTTVIVSVLNNIKKIIGDKKINVINVAKGIDGVSKQFFSKVISDVLGKNLLNICSLIGPSFATEVFQNNLTIINAVGKNETFLSEIADLFNNDTFKIVINLDEKGSEVYSALKNVLAIGIGISSGLYSAKNLAPALISIGLKEVSVIAKKLYPNSNPLSGYELAAIGDIVLTCLNTTSRNFSFGIEIAKNGLLSALNSNTKTVEGYNTAKILNQILDENNDIHVPFIQSIVDVLTGKQDHHNLLDFIDKL
ncbi:NAD(P)-binding domain-containing protein [Mycoplasma miroungigenitalium]|uniref:Glycerol-3-phosphate dehydrogenase n=2 Tax=Mycoplasma miroungigenitalium TaxID=754515 RepID=A0A6M4JCP9_9MOLU|nr:NAD(P)-binding domain-containing protein [Mycoplasma miroungigenitalium]